MDVAEFAKLHGGGGHKKAAGFTLNGTLEYTHNGYNIISWASNWEAAPTELAVVAKLEKLPVSVMRPVSKQVAIGLVTALCSASR